MEQQAYLGIDVSKGYADFILMDHNKTILEEGFFPLMMPTTPVVAFISKGISQEASCCWMSRDVSNSW